ncbi:hypothetical protein D3C81_1018540 [compost metagenome]
MDGGFTLNVLSIKQLKEIAEIIESHVGVMLKIGVGRGKPSPALLRKLGIPENAGSMIKNSFVLGKIVKLLEDNDLSKLTYQDLKEKARVIKLSTVEQNSLKYAESNAARYITALGQRVADNVSSAINNANQQANLATVQRNIIKDTVAQSILKQETRSKLASELGHNTGDWKRDWQRVAHTEIWNAKLQGEVVTILQGEAIYSNTQGGDTLVFRRPAPDACPNCKKLYLKSDGVTPKVFKLSELIGNGTNVGRKVNAWLPITGTTHPNCTCPIAVLPEGFGFDANGDLEYRGIDNAKDQPRKHR